MALDDRSPTHRCEHRVVGFLAHGAVPIRPDFTMTFSQRSGPPASARAVEEFLFLLNKAGHTDFRDARGPMGFTQRQAAGKFTREELAAFTNRLLALEEDGGQNHAVSKPRQSAIEQTMSGIPDTQLAAELRRRGWTVTVP